MWYVSSESAYMTYSSAFDREVNRRLTTTSWQAKLQTNKGKSDSYYSIGMMLVKLFGLFLHVIWNFGHIHVCKSILLLVMLEFQVQISGGWLIPLKWGKEPQSQSHCFLLFTDDLICEFLLSSSWHCCCCYCCVTPREKLPLPFIVCSGDKS